jgi:hypothetical protein
VCPDNVGDYYCGCIPLCESNDCKKLKLQLALSLVTKENHAGAEIKGSNVVVAVVVMLWVQVG